MPTTDHSETITGLREHADFLEARYGQTGRPDDHQMALSLRAAADLLEIHDATGLNLHQAPSLLAFVEWFAEMVEGDAFSVEDNGA